MSISIQRGDTERPDTVPAAAVLLHIGWRRKWLVALGLCIGVAAGAAIGMTLPRVYQSAAQISVIKKRPDAVTGIDTRQLSAEENMTPPQELLKSSLIIERAIQSKGLGTLGLPMSEDSDLTEAVKQALAVAPTRGPSGQTSVYKLTFRTRDAEASRAGLAAVLEAFRDFIDKKYQAVGEDTFELILREKQMLEKELADKEAAYRAFREKAPLLGKTKDGLELRQERLNSIQTKRSALLLQRVELEGQLAAINLGIKEGRSQDALLAMLAEFARKADAAEPARERAINLQEQLFPLLLEERKLLQMHGAKHSEVLDIRKRIEVARRLMLLPPTAWQGAQADGGVPVDAVQLHVQLLKQKLDHCKISEELLAGVFQKEQEEARRLAAFEIENDSFQTSIALHQRLYEALAKRLSEVGMARSVGGYQIELLEPPSLGKKVAPNMVLAVLIGACAGLGLGFGLAWWSVARTRPRAA
jgi:polysaccharide biosynthesis transport protein